MIYEVSIWLLKLFEYALSIVMRFARRKYLIYAVMSIPNEFACIRIEHIRVNEYLPVICLLHIENLVSCEILIEQNKGPLVVQIHLVNHLHRHVRRGHVHHCQNHKDGVELAYHSDVYYL